MSSSKPKRFVSVFDRLGPGTDEPVSGGSSRRLPVAEKHHSLSSPEQLTPRERKSSGGHAEQLSYREGRPLPLDHTQESDSDERFERRKSQAKGHKSGTKRRHRSSSESSDSGREGGSKRQKIDSESARRSKQHSFETDPKRRHHDKKDKPIGSAPVEVKTRPHGKDVATPHTSGGHKRRREDTHSEPRYGDRKRRHDDDLSSPYDYKKPRLSEASPHKVKSELVEHKRRYDPHDGKHPRSHTPEITPASRKPQERQSPNKNTDKKPKKEVELEGTSDTLKALDWDYLGSYTQRQTAKLDHSRPRSALERFIPGALFARVGVSPSLAGPIYVNVVSAVSAHLERGDDLFDSDVVGVARVRGEENVFQTGECRRALTASDDLRIRRKLRQHNQSEFLPQLAGRGQWESQLYSTGVALYQSLGKKSSGKPVYRVQDSNVGQLLVAR